MSNFYDTVLLREEFNLAQRLQKNTEFARYVTIQYEDRVTGETKPVLSTPTSNMYPEIYIVDYKMPVYVGVGQLRNDYHATAKITLSEPVLSNRRADHGPNVIWSSNFEPFNNHIRQDWICTGNAWTVAKDNGLWHLIISLGALLNQDEFVCAEAVHIDSSAYDYWLRRGRKPVSNIIWPLDILTKPVIAVVPTEKAKIKIVKKAPEQQQQQTQHSTKKITIIKK